MSPHKIDRSRVKQLTDLPNVGKTTAADLRLLGFHSPNFCRLPAKIDQHMQQLSAQGVNNAHAIINHMMGYVPNLHKIWIGASDQQLMALSHEFPSLQTLSGR